MVEDRGCPGLGVVVAVGLSGCHGPPKERVSRVQLVVGKGVRGDTHFGATVQHRSRVARDPSPNLRQVHLRHSEFLDELASAGFDLLAGHMGENAIVVASGAVSAGDTVRAVPPPGLQQPLEPV